MIRGFRPGGQVPEARPPPPIARLDRGVPRTVGGRILAVPPTVPDLTLAVLPTHRAQAQPAAHPK